MHRRMLRGQASAMRTSLRLIVVGLCWAATVLGAGLAVADGQERARDALALDSPIAPRPARLS